ncbi:RNase A-like domain-containing protein [Streptomyces sp. H27-D2]|uniref:RNase A-like domain-containing protein n=1 Tax=Streptomyces sp. H27-D2 TaxID=3046304 RepID=UPI002DBBDAE5|nr:RNase A-like domain-containing protein [Streptomyces sp. H27-D2]MEC4020546.1 RNase A-like domain-containing protein [Streptomyces sp. H27-D2]
MTDAQRDKVLAGLKTPPPNSGGGFDVKPSHLYYTSNRVWDEQFNYNGGAKKLVSSLSGKEQLAGRGHGADAFADAYKEVALRFLEVWSKSVVSVGGVSVGLTATANSYTAADWFTNQKQYGPPPRQHPPAVIDKDPDYGTVADLKWKGTNADSNYAIIRGIGPFPDFIADCFEEVIDKSLRLGKLYEITPGAHATEGELREIAEYWKQASVAALKSGENFTGIIQYITSGSKPEWQSAMNSFCQSIWGTTAWGKNRNGQDWKTSSSTAPSDRSPILTVLSKTALAMEQACHDLVDAATAVTDVSEAAGITAGKAMVQDMIDDFTSPSWDDLLKITPLGSVEVAAKAVLSFRSHMDYDGVNRAVETYHEACHGIATTLTGLLPPLNEAFLSAPTLKAEAARAEGFGSRSLNEFKHEQKWANPEDTKNGIYRIDLASNEELNGGHTIDKHVGKTDAQLAQRLRDQGGPPTAGWPLGRPSIGASSSFVDISSAQRLTQYNIDQNSAAIKSWLDGPPPPEEGKSMDFRSTAPNNEDSGRSVTKQANPLNGSGFKNDGLNVQSSPVKNINTRLKYDSRLNPPFVVLTSMPSVL